jgi:hypothetical protein
MPGPKLNNRRVFPDANHQPNHKAKFRMDEAKERQAAYDQLTIQQKLDLLDTRLGKGVGAVQQRARLAQQLEDQNKPKPAPEPKKDVAPTPAGEEAKTQKGSKDQPKKYMKGARQ